MDCGGQLLLERGLGIVAHIEGIVDDGDRSDVVLGPRAVSIGVVGKCRS